MKDRGADALLDARAMEAPPLAVGRPSTKREVWEHYSHIYEGIKSPDELARFCQQAWTWQYVYAFNFKGWRKQPNWVEGDPTIYEAIPTKAFPPSLAEMVRETERLYQIARSALAVATERSAA